MFSRTISTLTALALCAWIAACSKSGRTGSTVSPTAATPSVTLDSFIGTWTSASGNDGITPNACSALKYDINKTQDSRSATVNFNATCAGFVIAGTGAGTLAGSTLTWSTNGTISQNGSQFCAFDFKNNTATPEGTNGIRINYAGTVCGVPVSGSQVVYRK